MEGEVTPRAAIDCVVIDGPVSEQAPGARRVISRQAVGIEGWRCAEVAARETGHALMCIDTIGEIEPLTRIHLVQVFQKDGDDVPADRVLEGLKRAVSLDARVICLPLTIAETRHAAEFEAICGKAASEGIIIVAAWAPGVDHAIPASFKSVFGVERAGSQGAGRAVNWVEEHQTAGTPMSASRGTAVAAGLAASYLRLKRGGNLRGFAAGVEGFALSAAPMAMVPEKGPARASFDYSALMRDIGSAYREYLTGTPTAS
jgi:hypothetical protein